GDYKVTGVQTCALPIGSMTDRKRDQDCPLRLAQERQIDPLADVLRDRTPPEARLGPYPADDLVETPAPRPSLAPFGSASAEGKKHRAALSAATDYVELHARSAFSFLHGASLPEDLAAAAAEAGHAVFGLADVGGVYGAPRFHTAARNAGVRPLVGAELEVEGAGALALLCEDRQGYKNLCRLLTLGHEGREKGQCKVTLEQLAGFRRGLVALSAGAPGELAAAAATLFRDLPDAVRNTRAVAERCAFTLEDLGYEFPDPHLHSSTTLDGELWQRTLEGARLRYGGPGSARWPKAAAQIERELSLIEKLGLAGYFLIVHDLVQYCVRE